jgi:hypothetical protein
MSFGNRFITIYSSVLTAVFVVTILTAFSAETKNAEFDDITVKRINLVEPDGTLRLVISDKTHFPGLIIKGKEYPHERNTAGLIFFNDEGTENGGLIFGGIKDKDGKVRSWGHMSFDQYMQDQVFTVEAEQENDQKQQRLSLVDYPNYPITDVLDLMQRTRSMPAEQKQAEMKKFFAERGQPEQRLFLGRNVDKSVALKLKDTDGHDRLVIMVKPDGTPLLQFLDAQGKVIAQLPEKRD